jgi:transcriptional regulator with XRE-family HTH domain
MDWKALIQELLDVGMTQAGIAERCGVKQNTVSDLYRRESKRPSYEFGIALTKLHAKRNRRLARADAKAA